MQLTIYEAYDLSVSMVAKGEQPQAAIYHALQRDIRYEHDAERMLAHWHECRIPTFSNLAGYPK